MQALSGARKRAEGDLAQCQQPAACGNLGAAARDPARAKLNLPLFEDQARSQLRDGGFGLNVRIEVLRVMMIIGMVLSLDTVSWLVVLALLVAMFRLP
jgi:hypothetical protein